MTNGAFTEILLGLLAILLLYAAVVDVRTFTISNRLNLAIALLAPVYWLSVGLPLWPDAAIMSRSPPAYSSCSPRPSTPG